MAIHWKALSDYTISCSFQPVFGEEMHFLYFPQKTSVLKGLNSHKTDFPGAIFICLVYFLFQIGCMLQYWDAAQRDFVDWVEFYLSEQETSDVSLPDIDTPSKVRVSQIWRVSMDAHRDKSDDMSCDLEDEEQAPEEPLVLPATLAASLRVDSAVVTDLIAGIQLNLSMDMVRLKLEHHLQHFGKGKHTHLQNTID
jgi:hypothetical protein